MSTINHTVIVIPGRIEVRLDGILCPICGRTLKVRSVDNITWRTVEIYTLKCPDCATIVTIEVEGRLHHPPEREH